MRAKNTEVKIRNRYNKADDAITTAKELPTEKDKSPKHKSPYTVENFAWLIAGLLVCYYSDFFNVLWSDERIQRTWLNIALVLFIIFLGIASFLIVYLFYFKKVDPDNWDVLYPSAIPVATACSVLCGICLLVAAWPVWSLLTPVLLFIMFMAGISFICMLDIIS